MEEVSSIALSDAKSCQIKILSWSTETCFQCLLDLQQVGGKGESLGFCGKRRRTSESRQILQHRCGWEDVGHVGFGGEWGVGGGGGVGPPCPPGQGCSTLLTINSSETTRTPLTKVGPERLDIIACMWTSVIVFQFFLVLGKDTASKSSLILARAS